MFSGGNHLLPERGLINAVGESQCRRLGGWQPCVKHRLVATLRFAPLANVGIACSMAVAPA